MRVTIGQKVFLRPLMKRGSNFVIGREILEYVVIKVAKKHFEAWDGKDIRTISRWNMDTLYQVTDGDPTHTLHLDKQSILDKQEFSKLWLSMVQRFDFGTNPKVSLDQLRRINEILLEE